MTQRKWTDSAKAFYSEGGALLRHYSAVRATVVSMGLTVLFALWTIIFLYARDTASAVALFGISMIVFLFVCAVGIFFSGKYEQVRLYLLKLEAGSETRGPYEAVTTRYSREDWKLDMINWWIMGLGTWLQLTLLFIKLGIFSWFSGR
jgi:hypothetical protein